MVRIALLCMVCIGCGRSADDIIHPESTPNMPVAVQEADKQLYTVVVKSTEYSYTIRNVELSYALSLVIQGKYSSYTITKQGE